LRSLNSRARSCSPDGRREDHTRHTAARSDLERGY
jgi:hypothetical protein